MYLWNDVKEAPGSSESSNWPLKTNTGFCLERRIASASKEDLRSNKRNSRSRLVCQFISALTALEKVPHGSFARDAVSIKPHGGSYNVAPRRERNNLIWSREGKRGKNMRNTACIVRSDSQPRRPAGVTNVCWLYRKTFVKFTRVTNQFLLALANAYQRLRYAEVKSRSVSTVIGIDCTIVII